LALGTVAKRNPGGETEIPGTMMSLSGLFIGLVIGWVVQFF
jgi:hypothetical protein